MDCLRNNRQKEEKQLRLIFNNPTISFGTLIVDQTESWMVGTFVVYSNFWTSSGVVHPKLLMNDTYQAELHYIKSKVVYDSGCIVPIDERKRKKVIPISFKANRWDVKYYDLCANNEILLDDPMAYGGFNRWVEERKIHDCKYPNDILFHLHPAAQSCHKNQMVVFQETSQLPSEKK